MTHYTRDFCQRSRSPTNPLFMRGTLDAPSMFKRPNRTPKLCRRRFCNNLILLIDPPGPIEELSDFDVSLGIGPSVGTGKKIQNQTSDTKAVVIADGRAIGEANYLIQIKL
jgi:hypothetical protein